MIEIVPYDPLFREYFYELNQAWISKYFTLEEADVRMLTQPEKHVIEPGGEIFFALYENAPIGVIALIASKIPRYDYELAKMAVKSEFQGQGLGTRLLQAALDHAKKMGATEIFLESNDVLAPAIHLYRKIGFKEVDSRVSDYDRCNIQMSLKL